ncbi:MAG: hypothetical protein J0L99_00805 [Chitinophagales bacterium]|nr:hypothetical protein [Chitinophagales bacterium]
MKKILFSGLLTVLLNFTVSAQHFNITGTWVADVYEHGSSCRITWTIFRDNSSFYVFSFPNGWQVTSYGVWEYPADENILYEIFEDGAGAGYVEWVNRDYFILTILFNQNAGDKGIKRHYRRMIP